MKIIAITALTVTLAIGVAKGQSAPSPGSLTSADGKAFQMLPADAMNSQDSKLLALETPKIREAANIYNFNLSAGEWSVAQAACPFAPGHLILQFDSKEGDEAGSMFTAVVSRAGGSVRIIPILHHGVHNSWTFGKEPQERAFVDQVIRPDRTSGRSLSHADAANLAKCYAVLVGDQVVPADSSFLIIHRGGHGGLSELDFSAIGPDHAHRTWTIRFDRRRKIELFESVDTQEKIRSVPNAAPLKERPVASASPRP